MANEKISGLPTAGALTGTELVETVQGGVNVKTTAQDIADLASGGGAVDSVNGQTGVVVLDAGDVGADPSGSASTVASNLSDHIADTTAAHAGTAISNTPAGNIAATTVQGALNELDTEKAAITAVVGVQDLFIPAAAMWPRVTSGCSALTQVEMATSLFNVQVLDFDQTSQEFAQFQIRLPRKWNNGTITAAVYWTAASGSGAVVFGISAGAYSNDDALTVALGTAQTCTDTLIAANDLHITPTSSAITVAGTPADADFLAVQISRNPADGSDTLTADARVLGVVLFLTTDAAVDA